MRTLGALVGQSRRRTARWLVQGWSHQQHDHHYHHHQQQLQQQLQHMQGGRPGAPQASLLLSGLDLKNDLKNGAHHDCRAVICYSKPLLARHPPPMPSSKQIASGAAALTSSRATVTPSMARSTSPLQKVTSSLLTTTSSRASMMSSGSAAGARVQAPIVAAVVEKETKTAPPNDAAEGLLPGVVPAMAHSATEAPPPRDSDVAAARASHADVATADVAVEPNKGVTNEAASSGSKSTFRDQGARFFSRPLWRWGGESYGNDRWQGYDPHAFQRFYVWRPLPVVFRAAQIFSEVAQGRIRRALDVDVKVRAKKFKRGLIRLGPFYVKLGQALSTRPDILPPEYCAELASLQDKMPPFSSDLARDFIQQQLGAPIKSIFSEISEEPVAAASLGQVYRARLHSGQQVAVKVQRPGVVSRIALDSLLLRWVAAGFKRLTRGPSDYVAIVDELVGRMFEEVDYEREGQNAERFARLYGEGPTHSGINGEKLNGEKLNESSSSSGGKPQSSHPSSSAPVKVPRIFWQYSSKRILTMEWVDGIKLNDAKEMRAAHLDIKRIVDMGLLCSLRQLLEEGYFHADPHPGNLVVTRGGQLAYFDFGMMSELEPKYRLGLIQTLIHYVNRDAAGLARDFDLLGFLPPATDRTQLVAALRAALGEKRTKRSGMDFQGIFGQLSAVMLKFHFRLPAQFSLVIRALGSLEGTATTLDPEFKVVAGAYPFIVARLLADPSPEMRRILRELLICPNGAIRWKRLERLVSAISEASRSKQGEDGTSSKMSSKHGSDDDHDELRGSIDQNVVVAAASDMLDFVFSTEGAGTRAALLADVALLMRRTLQGGIVQQDNKLKESPRNFSEGLALVFEAMQRAPELWFPLLLKYSAKREAQNFGIAMAQEVTSIASQSMLKWGFIRASNVLRTL